MGQERAAVAYTALDRARTLSADAAPVERALFAALEKRYPNAAPLDAMSARPVLRAYADAMHAVALDFPDDLDVQTLYAEALMNVNAWKL